MPEIAKIVKPGKIVVENAEDIDEGVVCEMLDQVYGPGGKPLLGYVRTGRLYQRCPSSVDEEVDDDMAAFFDLGRDSLVIIGLAVGTPVTSETSVVGHRLVVRVLSKAGVPSSLIRDAVDTALQKCFSENVNVYNEGTGELKIQVEVADAEEA